MGRLKGTGEAGLTARKDKMWHKSLKDLVQGLPPRHKGVTGVAARTELVQGRKQERENEYFDKLMCWRIDKYRATLVPSLLMILWR